MAPPPFRSIDELLARYDVFFLDAYGVLNDANQALPGAADFLARIKAAGKAYCVLSNDASKSVETSLARYRGFGLPLDGDRIITSGSLLPAHFAAHGLRGKPCLCLGTEDAAAYVREAGGELVALDDERAEVVVVCDDDGFPFLQGMNQAITVMMRRLAAGKPLHLVLPNPDLVFPTAAGGFGLTAGAMATMLEAILRLRAPDGRHGFTALGKPNRPIFEAGVARLGVRDLSRAIMIGDQLVTDIRGANGFGLDSALILTGVSALADLERFPDRPTHLLRHLSS